ncbi:hypothetical protein GYMLUDRAFT_235443 [Collybiopsis luxurians FD-317 M1]|nr:hypothetical protein GYMLUDRAFT_235443 [Collybiopsis luxurians FD-317 M1]
MNSNGYPPYGCLESPTNSNFIQNIPLASDTGDPHSGYEWAPHYRRDDDIVYGHYEFQWPGYSHATGVWSQGSSYPNAVSAQYTPETPCVDRLPLHAPVPVPGTSSIFFTDLGSPKCPSAFPKESQSFSSTTYSTFTLPNVLETGPVAPSQSSEEIGNKTTQSTFPTPCELLNELNSGSPNSTPGSNSRESNDESLYAYIPAFTSLEPETADSSSITSHEKKRQYLLCLEQYVVYLHEQFKLIGASPIPIERYSTYRGMSSRNIRTLLAYMENSTAKLRAKTRAEEQRFLELRAAYLRQGGGDPLDSNIEGQCFSSAASR